MGFLTEIGEGFGIGVAIVTAGPLELAGRLLGSKELLNASNTIGCALVNTGKALGSVAENTVNQLSSSTAVNQSVVNQDTEKRVNQIIDDFMLDD